MQSFVWFILRELSSRWHLIESVVVVFSACAPNNSDGSVCSLTH